MQGRNKQRERQELEFEVSILSSLVAGLNARDDNVLGFISNLLERLNSELELSVQHQQTVIKTLAAIEDVIHRDGDFSKACQLIRENLKLIQQFMSTEDSTISYTPEELVVSCEGSKSSVAKNLTAISDITSTDSELLEFVSETNEYLASAETALLVLEKSPHDKESTDEVFRCFHNIKGIAGFFDLTDFQELAHAAESLMEGVRSDTLELTHQRSQLLFDSIDMLKSMVQSVKNVMSGDSYKTPKYLNEIIKMLQDAENDSPSESQLKSDKKQSMIKPSSAFTSDKTVFPRKTEDVVRVATTKLDALVDSVGELVIANGMVQQGILKGEVDPTVVGNVQSLGKIVRELQEEAMSLRMVSLEGMFQRLARITRDLSVKSSTPINFTFEGEDTELDRSVVEEIQSPLVHMIRNAVDHGIESQQERLDKGKPPSGRIHVSAAHQGGSVVLQIEDDGRGLNKQKILEKAVSIGLIGQDDVLADQDIYKLIFEPGFSTNEEVTEISGRGVGMDVVKQSVDKLRGRLEINVRPGQGTVFSIYLPLTMAIIDGMHITVGSHHFLIPSIEIQESLRPHPDQIYTVGKEGEMVLIREKLLPLIRLHKLFDIPNANHEPSKALVTVISDQKRRYALLIDDLVGQQQVVVKPMDNMFNKVPAVSGASIMGDGKVALILDTAGILRMSREVENA